MRRPAALWIRSDAGSLRIRGTLLLFGGRLLGDGFMTLAGRFDLRQARRRLVSGGALRRIHPR